MHLKLRLWLRVAEAERILKSANLKSVTLLYVPSLLGHNLVKNVYKTYHFRPKILKWFLYKPNQSVLDIFIFQGKFMKKANLGVTEKILNCTFFSHF